MGLRKYIKWKISNILFPAKTFIPTQLVPFSNLFESNSAWKGLEQVIPSILEMFNIQKESCIEFGVEHGFSTSIFAQFFKEVTGVDTFQGDIHAGFNDSLHIAQKNLSQFTNVTLIKTPYQEFTKNNYTTYNLCHIDIIHTYADTFKCGEWAVKHCSCVLFHDTESYVGVRKAVFDLAKKYNKTFYNYPSHNGLGILV